MTILHSNAGGQTSSRKIGVLLRNLGTPDGTDLLVGQTMSLLVPVRSTDGRNAKATLAPCPESIDPRHATTTKGQGLRGDLELRPE